VTADQISELAKQGILGFLLALTIVAIVYLYKGRLADWKEIGELVRNITATLRDWIAANEARTRAIEANARGQELAASAITHLATETAALRETIKELSASDREVRETMLKMGAGR
jgi:hypothetical protein